MAAEKMEQYKFRERPSRMKRVQALADHRGDNVSELIRDALKDYLRAHEHEMPDDHATGEAS
jgi:metal-responsive CopG/Arc/MetJ family transcriptional regulator